MLRQIKVTMPYELVGMELMRPYEKTPRNNRFVMSYTDYFTKHVTLHALPNKKASTIALCIKGYCNRLGYPEPLLSDRGGEFCNKINDHLCAWNGIKRSVTSAYHP